MKEYFIRRLLLVIPTLLGVTMLVFAITRIAPGSPLERALQQANAITESGGAGSGGSSQTGGMNEEQIEIQEEEYGYDKPLPVAYLQWLGLVPREDFLSKEEFAEKGGDTIGTGIVSDPNNEALVLLKGGGRQALVRREGTSVLSATYTDDGSDIMEDGWSIRIETVEERQKRWSRRNRKDVENAPQNYSDRAIVFRKRFGGILQGDLRRSYDFGDPVWELIRARIPIALYFGILTALITYGISLPLGILKAIKHRTPIDNITSILIFVGYSIPGFALGAILLVYLGARAGIFPLFGLTSDGFDDMDMTAKLFDLAHHTVLPLSCYVIGSFAFLTMMMKNNLMENLAADYVRTAVAKGASFRSAVFKHAFRNSFIPIASTLGQLITILVGGSVLVENVFDIQGFGLLQYQALLGRDVPVIMGTATIAAGLLLIGNILSDIIVALIDPRVKFN